MAVEPVEDLTPLDVTVTAKRYKPPATDPDEVIIQIGSTRLAGWKTVSITRSCEMMPNSFSVTASTQFMQGGGLALTRPGQPCTVYIGSDLVMM
jgi:prophage tail gpP-like protein